jgi:hypothetical protein
MDGIVRGLTRIYIPWWCRRRNKVMSETARLRASKRKMNVLAHQWGIKTAMPLYFAL